MTAPAGPCIAHITRRFDDATLGGTEMVLARCTPLLAAAGFSQQVLTSLALSDQTQGQLGSVPIERFPYLYPEWPLAAERRASFDRKGGNLVSFPLAARLRSMPRLDLVHLHTGNRLGSQCLRVAKRRGVPVVITLHGGNFAIPADEQAQLAGKGSRGGLPWGKVLSWWWGTRQLLAQVDAIICVGHEEFEATRKALPDQRVYFLPGGVDPQAFASGDGAGRRQGLGIPADVDLIVCPARLDAQKDQLTLVRAWAGLENQTSHLLLAGAETTNGYAEACREAAGDALARLHMPGNLPADAMPDVLAAADLVVLPSRHEPFGLVCLEAWAAKRCLVAAACGGPAWLLQDGGGLTFPVGDVSALQAILADLLQHADKRERYAAEGLAKVTERYSWQQRVDSLLAIYSELGVTVPTVAEAAHG